MGDMHEVSFVPCQVAETHQHRSVKVTVDLSQPHGFNDYPQIPAHLAPEPFEMLTWDQRWAPPTDAGWCPARDVVSETIQNLGIWEPVETITMLDLFRGLGPGGLFFDIGAQLGWYSILAQKAGMWVTAIEADPNVRRLLSSNIIKQGGISPDPVGPNTPPLLPVDGGQPKGVVKIDIEGAEIHAVRMIEPCLANRQIRAVLIELSPCFGVDLNEIASYFLRYGYAPAFMPDKSIPPASYTGVCDLKYEASWMPIISEAVDKGQINVLAVDSEWLENQEW